MGRRSIMATENGGKGVEWICGTAFLRVMRV